MTIPPDTVHVQFRGTLPDNEIFNWGFWLNNTTINSETDANGLAATIGGAWTANAKPNHLGLLPSTAAYKEIRVYCYPTGGPTALYIGATQLTSAVGTSTANLLPLQTAMVVSLRTGFAGRRARGRLYLPAIAQTLVLHEFSSSSVNFIKTDMATFFNAVNAAAGIGNVAVVSQVGAGSTRAVTQIQVDSKVDIQRRRANKQAADTLAIAGITL